MKVNHNATIKITHSRRGLQVIEKTWSQLCWGWFGAKDSRIPKLLEDLHKNKFSQIKDEQGTMTFVTEDSMYVEEESC